MDTRIIPHDSDCVNDFFQDEPLTLSEEITLELILNHTKLRGYCYAHNASLAEKRGVSIPTITRHVSKFCRLGYLTFRRVGNKRWLYPGINDYPMMSQRLADDDPQYTKVTKATKVKENLVCYTTENKQEKCGEQPVKCGKVKRAMWEADSQHLTDTPMLPAADADCVEVRTQQDDTTVETPSQVVRGEAEEEKSVESSGGVGHSGNTPQTHVLAAESFNGKSRNTTNSIPDCTKIAPGLHQNREEERNADKSRGTGCIDRNVKSVESRSRTDENSRAQTRTNAEITYSLLDNPRGDRVCGEGAKTGIADTLIANGVDTREAVKLAAQFDSAHIRRCVLYLLQTEAKGHKVENRGGFLVAALRGQWAFKLCKASPESIVKRHENLRKRLYVPQTAVKTETATYAGVAPDMAMLRAKLIGVNT